MMRVRRLRPSLAHLFDHQVRVWRADVVAGTLAAERRIYAVLIEPADVNAAVQRPRARLSPPLGGLGAGLAVIGERVIYMLASEDVRERDVIQIISGPELAATPATWEVDAPPTRPRGHHLELICKAFHGALPAVS